MSERAGATNPGVRAAVEAFAAAPSQQASIDVLRACLAGRLLLDVTGSSISYEPGRPGVMAAGSALRIATVTGPDGRGALPAFTSHAEIARVHPAGTEVQSLVQPAAGVLEFARSQGHAWLYLDPGGPTCALSAQEIDFALRVPRNDAVRTALEPGGSRDALLAALAEDGPLVLAADPDSAPGTGVLQAAAQVRLRSTSTPDGRPALLAFTSGPEAVARNAGDSVVTVRSREAVDMVRSGGYAGLVLNAAGPWAFLAADELPAR